MRVVNNADEVATAYAMAKSEAKKPLVVMPYILKNIYKILSILKYRLSVMNTVI